MKRYFKNVTEPYWNNHSMMNAYKAGWLEKQGEQNTTNKVEPKFEIEKGKWYVCDTPRYTDFVVGKVYYCPNNGMLKPNENEVARYVAKDCFHFWTIQDAKDGDVLYSLDSNRPFIYKERNNYEQATAYCGLNIYGKFFVWGTKDCVITLSNYVPATKEQRDLLFSKMKEAGYEWDCEKKELKMIEQNPVDLNSVSIRKLVDTYRNTDEYDEDGNHKGKPVNCMIRAYEQGIRDILKTIKQKNVNHVWSEENENGFSDGLYAIQQALINCLKLLMQE